MLRIAKRSRAYRGALFMVIFAHHQEA